MDYEINTATLAIVPLDENTSKVYEEEEEYIINKSSNAIIKDNCEFYGSSYESRCIGTKALTGIKTKYPIIIEESRNIIFFPTTSPKLQDCFWISLNNISDYFLESGNVYVCFKNGYKLKINISFFALENQILRSSRLESVLRHRKNSENK